MDKADDPLIIEIMQALSARNVTAEDLVIHAPATGQQPRTLFFTQPQCEEAVR